MKSNQASPSRKQPAPSRAAPRRIIIVTPAPPGSQKGNRVTAKRWAAILRTLGHTVHIQQKYRGEPADLLIALHARKSAAAVRRFAKLFPERPIIVTLTGTDLYHDLKRSAVARRSLEMAHRLILLQPEGLKKLPPRLRSKAHVIYQSVELPPEPRRPNMRGTGFQPVRIQRRGNDPQPVFRVCVMGHLRSVKDPFRTAMAARLLPPDSTIEVLQIGGATTKAMADRARREQARNPRYKWLGEMPRNQALRKLAQCDAMVLSSKMEGGANVVSEAIILGVPVLASRIPGSVGLLGRNYPGFFPVGDTAALAKLLYRIESDRSLYVSLYRQCRKLRPLFRPGRERRAWEVLLQSC